MVPTDDRVRRLQLALWSDEVVTNNSFRLAILTITCAIELDTARTLSYVNVSSFVKLYRCLVFADTANALFSVRIYNGKSIG